MEINVIGVQINDNKKTFFCNSESNTYEINDKIVINTERGLELCVVTIKSKQINTDNFEDAINTIVRTATDKDIQNNLNNIQRAKIFKEKTINIIKNLGLDMKLLSTEILLDNSKAYFIYTSEHRVDFRELVKTMANEFRMRIELKQVGVRDEAQIIGGLGPCGRPCCCGEFLNNFCNVSIKMAKNQGLSLNPQNISGLCGRLMCCLKYENEYYTELLKIMPKHNSDITTKDGRGVVAYLNFVKKLVTVKFMENNSHSPKYIEYTLEDLGIKETKILPCPESKGQN